MKFLKSNGMKIVSHGKLYEPISTIPKVQFCPECGHEEEALLHAYEYMTIFGHKYTDFSRSFSCVKCGCRWEQEERVKKDEWNKDRILAWVWSILAMVFLAGILALSITFENPNWIVKLVVVGGVIAFFFSAIMAAGHGIDSD